MFQNMIQSAIQSTLKQFITNLERTDFSLFSGTLDLKNIILNEDAMDKICGLSSVNLRLSSSFIDRVTIDIPIIDFLSRPHLHIKANSLYATLSLVTQAAAEVQENAKLQKDEEIKLSQTQQTRSMSSSDSSKNTSSSSNQEESLMATLKQKITRNLNIQLTKAKIILFSDLLEGFDLVLKIRNLHIINNKQSPQVENIDNLDEESAHFQQCDTLISIGHIQLSYFDSSLKKTRQFVILSEHKDIRVYTFSQLGNIMKQALINKKLIKFSETLEVRINQEVHQKIGVLWNFMTMRRPQRQTNLSSQTKSIPQSDTLKYETEFDFDKLQITVIDEEGRDKYISDVQGIKIKLSNFASVFKQVYSFCSATFKYHCFESDSYLQLLSILTSNLLTFEVHSLHDKVDFYLNAQDVIIRLFKLDESSKAIQDAKQVQDSFRHLILSAEQQQQQQISQFSQGLPPTAQATPQIPPQFNIQMRLFEIELMDFNNTEEENSSSKLTFSIQNIVGGVNKKKKNQVEFGNISFKIFDASVIDGIELRYVYDEQSQILSGNHIPICINLPKIHSLINQKNGIMQDIDSFFNILKIFASSPSTQQQNQVNMPQEINEKGGGDFIVQINEISFRVGYTRDILTLNLIQPRLVINSDGLYVELQVESSLIEWFTLHKFPLLERSKITLTKRFNQMQIEANNLRLQVYPESIIELRRIASIDQNFTDDSRMVIENKTMKQIQLVSKRQSHSIIVEPNQTFKTDFINFSNTYDLLFNGKYAFNTFNLHEIFYEYYKARADDKAEAYFFKTFVDSDNQVQFLLYIDCSNPDQIKLVFLERYFIINHFAPGIKIRGDIEDLSLIYHSKPPLTMTEIIDQIATSVQDTKLYSLYLTSQLGFTLDNVYNGQVSSQVTLPCFVFHIPQKDSSFLWECMILEPFIKLQSNLFNDSLDTQISYKDYLGELKEQRFTLEYLKAINMGFSSEHQSSSGVGDQKTKKLSQKILQTLKISLNQEYVVDLDKLSQGTFNLESTRSQTMIRAQIQQSFHSFNILQNIPNLIWVSETENCVPIQISIFPQIQFINETMDDLQISVHSFHDEETKQCENVFTVKQNFSADILFGQQELHQFRVGLKVHNTLMYTEKPILAIKNHTQYVTIIDTQEQIAVFLKIDVKYDKNTCIQIRVQPALKVKMDIEDQLGMLEIQNHNVFLQQVILDDPKIVLRFLTSSETGTSDLTIQNTVPDIAQDISNAILNKSLISLKLFDRKQIESQHAFQSKLVSHFLRDSPYDILKDDGKTSFNSIHIDLNFVNDAFVFEITQSQQTVLEVRNHIPQDLNCSLIFGSQQTETLVILPSQTVQFSNEDSLKTYFPNLFKFPLQIEASGQYVFNQELQLQLYEQTVIIDKIESLGFSIFAKLTKINKRQALLEFYSNCESPDASSLTTVTVNLDLKLHLMPFVFVKESPLLQLSIQDLTLAQSSNMKELRLGSLIVSHLYKVEETTRVSLLSMDKKTEIIMKVSPIIQLEKGIQLSMLIDKKLSSSQIQVIEKAELEVESVCIKFDELLKVQMKGFASLLNTQKNKLKSAGQNTKRPKRYLLREFQMKQFSLILSLNLQSSIVLQIEDAFIVIDQQQIPALDFEGEPVDFLNLIVRHLTLKIFHSLHRIIYHSNFMGNLPSIYSTSRQSLSEVFSSSSKLFAMFPIMNIAARGVFQFAMNLSSSIGGNLIKLTIGSLQTKKTDRELYLIQLDQNTTTDEWFSIKLLTLNPTQMRQYFQILPQESLIAYFDECLLEIEGKDHLSHMILMTHSVLIIYEESSQIRVIDLSHKNLRRVQVLPTDTSADSLFVKLVLGIKKRTHARINEHYFQLMSPTLNLEVPRRVAENFMSKLRQANLFDIISR